MAEPDSKQAPQPATERSPSKSRSPSPSPESQPATQPEQAAQAPAQGLDDRITLRVRDENENEYAFMVKVTTAFKRIFDAFAQKLGVRVRTFRFHFEGLRLADEDTPQRVGLADDDLIEAFVLAEGG